MTTNAIRPTHHAVRLTLPLLGVEPVESWWHVHRTDYDDLGYTLLIDLTERYGLLLTPTEMSPQAVAKRDEVSTLLAGLHFTAALSSGELPPDMAARFGRSSMVYAIMTRA